MNLENKKLEIFCGTGGVGKTTLASSRALYLAGLGKKVLLITIDPSKRLKQVFSMDDEKAGEISFVDLGQKAPLGVMLMNPSSTMERILDNTSGNFNRENKILEILSRPYAGMNEIYSLVEVNYQLNREEFDCIVLDTAPGKHFLDFLNSSKKINQFFNKSFVEIFQVLGKSVGNFTTETKAGKMFSFVVKSGINKLLSYMEKVSGREFIDEFIEAISITYQCKDHFLESCSLSERLVEQNLANWFLVCSVDQLKFENALELQDSINKNLGDNKIFLINKTMGQYFQEWQSDKEELRALKSSMIEKEEKLVRAASSHFSNILMFPELLAEDPLDQVKELVEKWPSHEG